MLTHVVRVWGYFTGRENSGFVNALEKGVCGACVSASRSMSSALIGYSTGREDSKFVGVWK